MIVFLNADLIDNAALTYGTIFIPIFAFQIGSFDVPIYEHFNSSFRKEVPCIQSLHKSRSDQPQGKRKEMNG